MTGTDDASTPRASQPTATRERRVLAAAGLLALGTVVVGTIIRQTRGGLGTATPPFVPGWDPSLDPLAVVALVVVVAGGLLLPRVPTLPLHPLAFAALLYVITLALGLGINLAHLGTDGWSDIYDLGPDGSPHARNEYLPGLPALGYGAGYFLDRFAELVPSQTVNVGGHPPGPMLLIHWLGITSAGGLAAFVMGAGALGAPLTYAAARTLHGDGRAARTAGVAFACSPAVLLIGFTAYDLVFAAAGAAAAWGLLARGAGWRVLGAAGLAASTLLTWALLGIGAWAALVALRRDGWRAALVLAAGCGVAVLALDAALYAAYGYDAIGALRATEELYRNSVATKRPYAFWVFGSPTAWGVMAGIPILAAALRAAARGAPAAQALVVVIVVAAVAGFTKAETERIWLIFVPLACIAAGPVLATMRLGLIVPALLAQALVIEVLFNTVW